MSIISALKDDEVFEAAIAEFSANDPAVQRDRRVRGRSANAHRRRRVHVRGGALSPCPSRARSFFDGNAIAHGYATLGQIGFADHIGYAAIGTVCNLAARLCAEAKDGQILVAQRVAIAVEETTVLEEIGAFALKGLTRPAVAFNVLVSGSACPTAPDTEHDPVSRLN